MAPVQKALGPFENKSPEMARGAWPDSSRESGRPLHRDLRNPTAPALSVAVGIVCFNNTDAELADLARTLQRASARLSEWQAQANPSNAFALSIRLHNNGAFRGVLVPGYGMPGSISGARAILDA
jgi:hypothetical protein